MEIFKLDLVRKLNKKYYQFVNLLDQVFNVSIMKTTPPKVLDLVKKIGPPPLKIVFFVQFYTKIRNHPHPRLEKYRVSF